MSDLPYTSALLRLAADAHGAGRLEPPCLSHTEQNPVCGDRTTMDIRIAAGRIEALAHDTRACVLTQAAASLLAAAMPGHTAAELEAIRTEVKAMLDGGPAPDGDFAEFRHLADVARHPARHRCVLLPIDAVLKAAAGKSLSDTPAV